MILVEALCLSTWENQVLLMNNSQVEFFHASFSDFLKSETRGGCYYIGRRGKCAQVIQLFLQVVLNHYCDYKTNDWHSVHCHHACAYRSWFGYLSDVEPTTTTVLAKRPQKTLNFILTYVKFVLVGIWQLLFVQQQMLLLGFNSVWATLLWQNYLRSTNVNLSQIFLVSPWTLNRKFLMDSLDYLTRHARKWFAGLFFV